MGTLADSACELRRGVSIIACPVICLHVPVGVCVRIDSSCRSAFAVYHPRGRGMVSPAAVNVGLHTASCVGNVCAWFVEPGSKGAFE